MPPVSDRRTETYGAAYESARLCTRVAGEVIGRVRAGYTLSFVIIWSFQLSVFCLRAAEKAGVFHDPCRFPFRTESFPLFQAPEEDGPSDADPGTGVGVGVSVGVGVGVGVGPGDAVGLG